MTAHLGKLPADDRGWAYEVKLDGVRAIGYVDGSEVCLESRNLRDVTSHYPELRPLGSALGGRQAVLDGEIVAADEQGRPSFQQLQTRMHVVAPPARLVAEVPVAYLLFDLLWLDGEWLVDRTYEARRAELEGLALTGPSWSTPAYHRGDGAAMLEATRVQGLEGLVAKRLDSIYTPGKRSRAWFKIKNKASQELVVGGWCPGEGNRLSRIGALMVGYCDGDALRYAGNVGTGFTDKHLRELQAVLEPLRRPTCPFDPPPPGRRGAVWVEPRLVVEVEFTEWTRDGTLRHPAYKGVRNDKNPREVVREKVS